MSVTGATSRVDASAHPQIAAGGPSPTARRAGAVPWGRPDWLRAEAGASEALVARAVARAKQGDDEAVRFLYVRFAGNVRGLIAAIVRDDDEAQDLTQQVFLKLLTKLDRYEEREAPFLAWLLRVARNVALEHLRRRRPIVCEEVHAADARNDERVREARTALRQALTSVPRAEREVVVLRHLVGLGWREISERLGRSESSVLELHRRGRDALRRELTMLGSGPAVPAPAAPRGAAPGRRPAPPGGPGAAPRPSGARSPGHDATLAARVRLPRHVVYRSLAAETVLLNLDTRECHRLEPAGGRMLEALEGGATVGATAADLGAREERPRADMESDLCALCDRLARRGLIELVSGH